MRHTFRRSRTQQYRDVLHWLQSWASLAVKPQQAVFNRSCQQHLAAAVTPAPASLCVPCYGLLCTKSTLHIRYRHLQQAETAAHFFSGCQTRREQLPCSNVTHATKVLHQSKVLWLTDAHDCHETLLQMMSFCVLAQYDGSCGMAGVRQSLLKVVQYNS